MRTIKALSKTGLIKITISFDRDEFNDLCNALTFGVEALEENDHDHSEVKLLDSILNSFYHVIELHDDNSGAKIILFHSKEDLGKIHNALHCAILHLESNDKIIFKEEIRFLKNLRRVINVKIG